MRSLALFFFAAFVAVPATADVFIPEGDANSVLHLDDLFETVGRIEGLDNVHGIDVAPGRGLLVAGSLSLHDAASGEMNQPTGVSDANHEAHHGAAGGIDSDTVSNVTLIALDDYSVAGVIEVPGMVHHVAVDADERFAILTHPGLDGVSLIDLETRRLAGFMATGPEPEYPVWSEATNRFLVSNVGNATISELDPERMIVNRNIPVDGGTPRHLDLGVDGTLAVALADEGRAVLIGPDGTQRVFDIGGELHGIQLDNSAIFVAATELGKVVRIELETSQRREAAIGREPYHAALVGDSLLVSSATDPVIHVLDPETLTVRQTIETAGIAHQIRDVPDL